MILEFLNGEFNSNRFNEDLNKALDELKLDSSIITNGDLNNNLENLSRKLIMNIYRGYPDKELFNNFPTIKEWKYVRLTPSDIKKVFYIDYDYWNELSNNTSSPLEAVKTINSGKEIFDVSNKPFLDGIDYLKKNKFPPVILITCNDKKFLIVEGHSRMTVYAFDPSKLKNTFAYVGYCTEEEMKKYDSRMI